MQHVFTFLLLFA